jgi:DNA-binding phage protein
VDAAGTGVRHHWRSRDDAGCLAWCALIGVEHARRVQALRSRNALLTVLETTREQQGMTKRALAERAGLEASGVRRLLTSETANPTTDNAFRLMAAMGIRLDATLPTGERVQLVSPDTQTPAPGRAAAA